MIRYITTALALKAFSATPATRSLYRLLGNRVGAKRRAVAKMEPYYATNVRWMLGHAARSGAIKDFDNVLEVGTGWMHWEAVCLSLFYDIEATLFDVWDCRQPECLKNNLRQLDPLIDDWAEVEAWRRHRAHTMIRAILGCESFEKVYGLLHFRYVVEPSGSFDCFPSAHFNVIVSARVLEHIDRDKCPQFCRDCFRVLKPGGYSLQSISIGDHLYQYDRNVNPKQYLAYSDKTWKRWFENRLQYVNLWQADQWLAMFETYGFLTLEDFRTVVSLEGLKLDERWASHSLFSLTADTQKLVNRRPADGKEG